MKHLKAIKAKRVRLVVVRPDVAELVRRTIYDLGVLLHKDGDLLPTRTANAIARRVERLAKESNETIFIAGYKEGGDFEIYA
jgi:hypothetical protein